MNRCGSASLVSGFFLFHLLDRAFERGDERLWVGQVLFSQLEFRHQHTVFINKNQAIMMFHVATFFQIRGHLGFDRSADQKGQARGSPIVAPSYLCLHNDSPIKSRENRNKWTF